MRFVPLSISCPGPVLRLVRSGGVDRARPPRAWLWAVRPLLGGPVRPGRSGSWGVGGRSVCRPPSGAWLGGPGARGAGGCSASVRPSPALEQAPRRALSALLSPWRMWSPYCSGWCPCASVRARSEGCPCIPAGGWRAGWQAGWRRGLPRSLWERAGDGPGARGAWAQASGTQGPRY